MKRPEGVGVPGAASRAPSAPAKAAKRPSAPATKAAPQARPASATQARASTAPISKAPISKAPTSQVPTSRSLARERRRYERLEVKRFTRRARRRRTGWFVAVLLVIAVGGLVSAAVFSPLLALRTITVDGTSRLSSTTLEKAVDGQLGTPLALLNYGTITKDLAPFTLIRSYVTEIVPPDRLVIHVVERTPIGAIQGAGTFDLVDPAGVTIESSKTRPAGYPLVQLGDGRLDGPGFASMAQVLLALPPAVLTKVDTITAQTHDDVTLTLTGSNQRVVWGSSDDSDAKARLLADLIALHSGSGAGEYDVSAPGTAVFHHD
ncbi:MAG: FtsQ-type POTRA domain-containing protein [Pseudolysinimonas sp.]